MMNVNINHRKASSSAALMNKIESRLNSWSGKQIYFKGRITLVQFVLSAIPVYCLSFYRLPKRRSNSLSKFSEISWGREGGENRLKVQFLGWGGKSYVVQKIRVCWGLGILGLEVLLEK